MKNLLYTLLLTLSIHTMQGQSVLRFTGVVIDQETVEPVHGVYIFNLTANRGAATDSLGFFSIAAKAGDSILFQDLRYEVSKMVVPAVLDQTHYGIIQMLTPVTHLLEEVQVYSLPSQEEFVSAFMKIKVPQAQEEENRRVTMDLMKTVKESYNSDKYYYEMWANRRLYDLTGKIQPNHIIDPFRWTEVIRSLKKE